MSTISQENNTLYLDNSVTNGSCSFFINSTEQCKINTTGISTSYRVPAGTTGSNPVISDIRHIGCTLFIPSSGRILSSSTDNPINLLDTGILPIGTYIIGGYLSILDTSAVAISVNKWGMFFDTSSALVSAATSGTPYFSSGSVINTDGSTSLTIAVNGGIRMHNTMIINLTIPTIIYLNCYCKYTSGPQYIPYVEGRCKITRIA